MGSTWFDSGHRWSRESKEVPKRERVRTLKQTRFLEENAVGNYPTIGSHSVPFSNPKVLKQKKAKP